MRFRSFNEILKNTGRGFPATFGFVIAALLSIILIQLLHTRELKQQQRRAAENPQDDGDDGAETASKSEGEKEKDNEKKTSERIRTSEFQELASGGMVVS